MTKNEIGGLFLVGDIFLGFLGAPYGFGSKKAQIYGIIVRFCLLTWYYCSKTPQTLRLSVWKYARSFLLWLHSQDGWVIINSCLFMMDGIYACVAWYIITHAFVIIMDIYAYWIQSLSVLLFSHHSSLSLFQYGYASYWWETFAAVTFRHIHSLSTHHNCRSIIV